MAVEVGAGGEVRVVAEGVGMCKCNGRGKGG